MYRRATGHSEEVFADALLQRFTGRTEEAREFSLRHRVLLLRSDQGVPLDIAFGAMPFEERAVGRASDFPIEAGASLKTCSAGDLRPRRILHSC